jgi:hypothetical protein
VQLFVSHAKPSFPVKAQEYLETLKKSSIVVVKLLMLYLIINNLCVLQCVTEDHNRYLADFSGSNFTTLRKDFSDTKGGHFLQKTDFYVWEIFNVMVQYFI